MKNPSSKTKAGDIAVAPPPKYVESIPAYFAPEPRLKLLDELSFCAPEMRGQEVEINRAFVKAALSDIVEDTDLSRYIL